MKPLETLRDWQPVAAVAVGPFCFISTTHTGVVHHLSCRWGDLFYYRDYNATMNALYALYPQEATR